MKRLILFFVLLSSYNIFAVSFEDYGYGIGGNIGTSKGLNLLAYDKDMSGTGYQLNISLDVYSNNNIIDLSLDRLFFSELNNNIPVYAGVGIKLSDEKNNYLGLRALAGISYFVSQLDDDLEIFAHLVPTVYVTNFDDLFVLEYGLGARYYF